MNRDSSMGIQQATGYFGLSAVSLFILAFAIFSQLSPDFRIFDDYVSKLGSKGHPLALWWNLIGFVSVGALLIAFGWAYGQFRKDMTIGILFILFGIGFSISGIPADMDDSGSTLSAAHIIAICLSLAAWCGGLARLAGHASVMKTDRRIANVTGLLLVAPMIGYLLGFWSMPLTHRLVFLVVFGWIAVTSMRLLTLQRRRAK